MTSKTTSEEFLARVNDVEKSLISSLDKVSEKLSNSTIQFKTMTYSSVTKGGVSTILIKPKDQLQTSEATKTIIKQSIDATKFNVQKVRNVNKGGSNKNTIARLKKYVETKLRQNYEIMK